MLKATLAVFVALAVATTTIGTATVAVAQKGAKFTANFNKRADAATAKKTKRAKPAKAGKQKQP